MGWYDYDDPPSLSVGTGGCRIDSHPSSLHEAAMYLGESYHPDCELTAEMFLRGDEEQVHIERHEPERPFDALSDSERSFAKEMASEQVRKETPRDVLRRISQRDLDAVVEARARSFRYVYAEITTERYRRGARGRPAGYETVVVDTIPVPVAPPRSRGTAAVCPDTSARLADLLSEEAVGIEYRDARHRITDRVINPLRQDGHLLVAYCHLVEGERHFRVDRIQREWDVNPADYRLPA